MVGAPARFTVETSAAGTGELEVVVLNPKGTPEKVVIPHPARTHLLLVQFWQNAVKICTLYVAFLQMFGLPMYCLYRYLRFNS